MAHGPNLLLNVSLQYVKTTALQQNFKSSLVWILLEMKA